MVFQFHLLMENYDQIAEIPEYHREYGISSFKFWTGLEGPASLIPAWMFAGRPSVAGGKRIETMSGIWTIGMYLILGATPIAIHMLGGA